MTRLRGWWARLSTPWRVVVASGGALAVLVLVAAIWLFAFFQTNSAEVYADEVENFKYGSIASEAGGGIPYLVWQVLPEVFADHLPPGEGSGYERFGFLYEAGRERPIGTSIREMPFPMIGLNCASCHVGTVRTSAGGAQQRVLGMPAQQLDFLRYQRFLIAAAEDPKFNADTLLPAMQRIEPDLGWLESLAYRYVVIPRLRDGILDRAAQFEFLNDRPDWGPGRVDTFSPYKVHFGIDMTADRAIGAADLPSLWNQGVRAQMQLHWDGNNDSLDERNRSAALGAGATEESIDVEALNRIARWVRDLPPPQYPRERIDAALAEAGRPLYEQQCASCHSLQGARVGKPEPLASVRTDPERSKAFGPEIAAKMNTYGAGEPWAFSRFRTTEGYANAPLDGAWLRAPFLHNGSVPTLRDLLRPAAERPKTFYRGYDVFDFENVGFVSQGAEAERTGFRYDTSLPGNGNGGHEYGTELTAVQVRALLEFLKTQ